MRVEVYVHVSRAKRHKNHGRKGAYGDSEHGVRGGSVNGLLVLPMFCPIWRNLLQ